MSTQPEKKEKKKTILGVLQGGMMNRMRQNMWLYHLVFINRTTTERTLIKVNNIITNSKLFTLDTESTSILHQPNKSSLIQIQIIQSEYSSIILIVEVCHLPSPDQPPFTLIKILFDLLFQPDKKIYIWGEIDELIKFTRYQLFTSNQIYLSRNINVQTKFKNYWSDTYLHQSASSSNDAVAFELHRWIDKRLTRQPFDIGLDPSLQHLNDKQMEYRQSLCNYAANDCDAIYQLIINTNIINEQDPDNTTSSITPTNYELEITTDDNDQINNQESPLPSINTSTNEPEHKQLSQEEKKKIHNRSCTIKQRRRYYQHEIIIKNIDKRFKIREIKDILKLKNISFFAVNISISSTTNKRKLYIGIRDPSKLSSYKIQTEGLFTRNHYEAFRREK
ncbi:unnamed protein product [Rotaria sordida]|uniref:Uncharacterized protein n=1 Tax=Rotaria sordida TaxID=392033 RepID=A0A815E867_9BILA|nr:unnamed protein product [Rotaria sordida]CAF1308177.1 unnamed protein product [Rotaria sordida]